MNPFWRAYFSTGLVQPPTRQHHPQSTTIHQNQRFFLSFLEVFVYLVIRVSIRIPSVPPHVQLVNLDWLVQSQARRGWDFCLGYVIANPVKWWSDHRVFWAVRIKMYQVIQFMTKECFSRWWFQFFLIFTLIPGEMIQIDEHIFQMGWFNHQLAVHFFVCFFLRSFFFQRRFFCHPSPKQKQRVGCFFSVIWGWRNGGYFFFGGGWVLFLFCSQFPQLMVTCWFGAFGGLGFFLGYGPQGCQSRNHFRGFNRNPNHQPKATINHYHGNLRGPPQCHVYPQEIAGLIKGLLTIGFP